MRYALTAIVLGAHLGGVACVKHSTAKTKGGYSREKTPLFEEFWEQGRGTPLLVCLGSRGSSQFQMAFETIGRRYFKGLIEANLARWTQIFNEALDRQAEFHLNFKSEKDSECGPVNKWPGNEALNIVVREKTFSFSQQVAPQGTWWDTKDGRSFASPAEVSIVLNVTQSQIALEPLRDLPFGTGWNHHTASKVLFHEMGHLLGLVDLYVEDERISWKYRQLLALPGQNPSDPMANSRQPGSIQNFDVTDIKAALQSAVLYYEDEWQIARCIDGYTPIDYRDGRGAHVASRDAVFCARDNSEIFDGYAFRANPSEAEVNMVSHFQELLTLQHSHFLELQCSSLELQTSLWFTLTSEWGMISVAAELTHPEKRTETFLQKVAQVRTSVEEPSQQIDLGKAVGEDLSFRVGASLEKLAKTIPKKFLLHSLAISDFGFVTLLLEELSSPQQEPPHGEPFHLPCYVVR